VNVPVEEVNKAPARARKNELKAKLLTKDIPEEIEVE
jgi:hypothetical protein